MKRLTLLQIGNIVALVLVLIMNGLSQAPDLFPNTVGQLGESRAIFFLPAGYVFSIWGVIYIGLIGFAIYQVRRVGVENEVPQRVGPWFIISSIGNITWLVLFLYDQVWLSTVAMLVILFSLIMIYLRLGIGRRAVGWQERWAVHIPFSIYLGWISVATVANFSAALYVSDQVTTFLGINADIWAVVMMAVAGVLAAAMLLTRRDIAYALVVVWALVGINVRPFDTDVFSILAGLDINLVNSAALVVAGVIGVGVVLVAFSRFLQTQSNPQRLRA